ncbi:MAG TPA: hypothetical protein VE996_00480 [Terriglobales bacterium]|nr:hypothetical protein [Terriglobales bacterium]
MVHQTRRDQSVSEAALRKLVRAGIDAQLLRGWRAAAGMDGANRQRGAEAERKRKERWRGKARDVAAEMERFANGLDGPWLDAWPADISDLVAGPSAEEVSGMRKWIVVLRTAASVVRRWADTIGAYAPPGAGLSPLGCGIYLSSLVRELSRDNRPHYRELADLFGIDRRALEKAASARGITKR